MCAAPNRNWWWRIAHRLSAQLLRSTASQWFSALVDKSNSKEMRMLKCTVTLVLRCLLNLLPLVAQLLLPLSLSSKVESFAMEASAILLSNAATTYNNKAMISDVAQHTQLTHSFTLIWKLEAGTTIDQFTQTTDDRIMYGRSVAQHVVIWHPNALVYGLFYCTLCWVIPCHYVRL